MLKQITQLKVKPAELHGDQMLRHWKIIRPYILSSISC